jgi:hypothetical protein
MKKLGKFSFYTPDEAAAPAAQHIRNDDGTDWYTISWDKERVAQKFYVGTDDSGQVIAVTDNGAMFFPANMAAWEIPKDEAPENLLTMGYNAKIIYGEYSVDYASLASKERQNLLAAAGSTISLWQTKLLAGKTLTDHQKQSWMPGWITWTSSKRWTLQLLRMRRDTKH